MFLNNLSFLSHIHGWVAKETGPIDPPTKEANFSHYTGFILLVIIQISHDYMEVETLTF